MIPQYEKPYLARASLYAHNGEKEKAVADLTRLLELNPKQDDARKQLAKLQGSSPVKPVTTPPKPK